jgi:uncharacterized delta-60 repeat protein
MKNLFILILLVSIVSVNTNASHSSQYWAKTYGGRESDGATSIQETSDGGYIVAGYTESFAISKIEDCCFGVDDFWILKLDNNGKCIWEKSYGSSHGDSARSIQETSDGGYIVTGSTGSHFTGEANVLILKLDSNGNVTWEKAYSIKENDSAYSIQETSDGGYIVAGNTYSVVRSDDDSDMWILKLDSNGNVTWEKTYGGRESDGATSIQETSDGGYIVAGSTRSFGAGNNDIWVLKLDGNGNIFWQKTYGGTHSDVADSIQEASDGGYIVAGSTYSFSAGFLDSDVWVLKLNGTGNVIWQKTYSGSGSDSATSIQKTSDGSYIVTGGTHPFGVDTSDAWVLKLDGNGNISWQKTYGGSKRDNARSILETSDGGYIVAGGTESFGAGDYAFLVLKIDSNGEIPGCGIIGTNDAVVSNTSISGQESNAVVESTSATIYNNNVLHQDSSAKITTVCYGGLPCPTEEIYGEYSKETASLRNFRDDVLSQTPESQETIRLYYQWSPAIVKAMEKDEEFKEEIKEMIDGVLGLIEGKAE